MSAKTIKKAVAASKSKAKKTANQTTTKATSKSAALSRKAAATFIDTTGLENLSKINHIVVLMMENRSFDQMLGYLKLDAGRNVDGLTSTMSNSLKGQNHPVFHLPTTALNDGQDPCHDGACVDEQLSNNSGGFVLNFHNTHLADPHPELVMGYHNAKDVQVYDHLAKEFSVCDKWFSSVPGATWPNRLYAVTGRCDGKRENKRIPIYDIPSFVRHLDAKKVAWRWYSHDFATLALTDSQYRVSPNYYKFDQRILFRKNFLDHAREGKLPAVSWIDPNFVDVGGATTSNDDHPPSDIRAGQELVLKLYNALVNSPQWNKTMLIITYDEHGGFYDHVAPPAAADDNANFRRFGARVPAIVVSPFVKRGSVSSVPFDHTSIIKTILLRFCRGRDGSIPGMGARVNAANHLGSLLTEAAPRSAPAVSSYKHAIDYIANWRAQRFTSGIMATATATVETQEPQLSEFQQGMIAARKKLMKQGKL